MLVRSAHTVASAYLDGYNPTSRSDTIHDRFGQAPKHKYYAKGAQIFGEGDPTDIVYQVVTGAVRNYKLLSDGRCQITAFHLQGDIFGFDFCTAHRTAAEAIINTSVRVAKRHSLEQAAINNASTGDELWRMTANQLKHAEDHLLLLGRKTALERVASFLIEMDDRLGGNGNLPLPMRRRDIGDYLGLTIETVSRVLSALHDEGIIEFSGARQISLCNRARLRTIELFADDRAGLHA